MKVLVTGSRGLIGTHLCRALAAGGHRVVRAVHGAASEAHSNGSICVAWDANAGFSDLRLMEGIDAAIHLAGEPVSGLWSDAKRIRIRQSRLEGLRRLLEAIWRLSARPATLICASAMGYYGDRGDTVLDEMATPGTAFLSGVARDVEQEAQAAGDRGLRVVLPRLAMVLSPEGGAMAKMLPAFRAGLGGPIAGGKQYWSWIDIDDAAAAILYLLERQDLFGAFNVGSPNPVTNEEFARTLGAAVGRPAVVPMPALALKVALGQMAQEVLLASTRMTPRRLAENGFVWRYPQLAQSLAHLLSPEKCEARPPAN